MWPNAVFPLAGCFLFVVVATIIDAMFESKKKCRQYSVDYLKLGFIPLLDKQLPMCLLCNKFLSNDAMAGSSEKMTP